MALFNKTYKQPSLFCKIYNWFKYPRFLYLNGQNSENAIFRGARNFDQELDGTYLYILEENEEGFDSYKEEEFWEWYICDKFRDKLFTSDDVLKQIEKLYNEREYK